MERKEFDDESFRNRPLSNEEWNSDWIMNKNDFTTRPARSHMSDYDIKRQLKREGLLGGFIRTQPLRKTRNGNLSFYIPLYPETIPTTHNSMTTIRPPRLLKNINDTDKGSLKIQERLQDAQRRREDKLHFVETRARSGRKRGEEAIARTEKRRAEIRKHQNEKHEKRMKLAEKNSQREAQEAQEHPDVR